MFKTLNHAKKSQILDADLAVWHRGSGSSVGRALVESGDGLHRVTEGDKTASHITALRIIISTSLHLANDGHCSQIWAMYPVFNYFMLKYVY
jgi:hypothetical protein